jgi:tetratricopeptide (TPR) repeat protein
MGWLTDALNAPARRLIGDRGPEVLPWGAWAEFAQRHLAMLVGRADAYYRHMLGSDAAADREKRRLKDELGTLWMFPAATAWWTKGPRGGEADFTFINQAVDRIVEAPHRQPAMAWWFIETGTKFEPVRRGLPPPRDWFVRPSPRAMYDAASRVKHSGHPRRLADIEAMRKEAPYDYPLAVEYLTTKYGEKASADQMFDAYGTRWNYDLRVMRAVVRLISDDGARVDMLARSCALSAYECVAFGAALARLERDAEAAAAYERAFGDPAVDAVAVANNSAWLVSYYYRTRQFDRALAQAARAASTGASDGLYTAAYLDERLGRLGAAEDRYKEMAQRYESTAPLIGFYYRVSQVQKRPEYRDKWNGAISDVFPEGLVTVSTEDAKPQHGVIVVKDSELSRKAGLQAGDIIVGLEGFRVENLHQYYAINSFDEREDMKLTAWRGRLSQVSVKAPRRLMGVEFRTYPIAGWSEK